MKTLLTLALALVLLFAFDCSTCEMFVNIGGNAAVLTVEGEEIVPFGAYSVAFAIGDGSLMALRDAQSGLYLIADKSGEPLTEALYDSVAESGERLIIEQGGVCSIFDYELNALTESVYSAVYPAEGGFFAFKTPLWDDNADTLYTIDKNGEESTLNYKLLFTDLAFASGLTPAISAQSGRYGYMDERGIWRIEPNYIWAGSFSGGLAVVTAESGCGLIDTEGNRLLSALYSDMLLSESYVICREHGAEYVYLRSPDGLIMLLGERGIRASALNEFYAVYDSSYVYLYDGINELRATFSPDTLLYPGFKAQVIASDKNGMYVYDANRREMSDFYDRIFMATDAEIYVCAVSMEDSSFRFGAILTDGRLVLPPKYLGVIAVTPNTLAAETEDEIKLFRFSDASVREIYSYSKSKSSE